MLRAAFISRKMLTRYTMLLLLAALLNACGGGGSSKSSSKTSSSNQTNAVDASSASITGEGGMSAGSVAPGSVQINGSFRERQRQLSPMINRVAKQVGVDPFFVHGIVSAESAYKTSARSGVGAGGLMQLMPATAKRFGITDRFNPEQNVRGGSTYLKWLLNRFGQQKELAAAGYNAGEGNVQKYGNKIPPFNETRAYVPKVMGYYRKYKQEPGLIGMDVSGGIEGSDCDARGIC
ncbi:MAG: lytic transglycosylase domain-containing protein [Cardiobacteriaceae bacterium]|nr:lytic transglycosylase domain-containing protein [Cardiobacteriaceae bacterium]